MLKPTKADRGGNDMTDLATRIEQASAPDRELDAEIAMAMGREWGGKSGFCNNENGDYYITDECAVPYTASLDAAMTLASPHWSVCANGDSPGWQAMALLYLAYPMPDWSAK